FLLTFFFAIRRPPLPTLLPYTTLFRSRTLLRTHDSVTESPSGGDPEGGRHETEEAGPSEAVRERPHARIRLTHLPVHVEELIPGGGFLKSELLEDVGSVRERVVGPHLLVQPRQHVVFAVLLFERIDIRLQRPLRDFLHVVRHLVDVVTDWQDRTAGDEGGLLPRVSLGDHVRGITGADQERAFLL